MVKALKRKVLFFFLLVLQPDLLVFRYHSWRSSGDLGIEFGSAMYKASNLPPALVPEGAWFLGVHGKQNLWVMPASKPRTSSMQGRCSTSEPLMAQRYRNFPHISVCQRGVVTCRAMRDEADLDTGALL